MKTKAQTTYILLERGVEDKALYYELVRAMIICHKKITPLAFAEKFPKLTELRQSLRDELSDQGFFE